MLQAHINIAWRDRAAFRDQWIERLQRVYLRQPQDPDPNMASLKAWRMWKELQRPKVIESVKDGSPALHGREVSHVLVTPHRPSGDVSEAPEEQHNSDNHALSHRRSKRISDQVILQAALPPEEPEAPQARGKGRRKRGHKESDAISIASNHDEQDREDWRDTPESFIQGLCSIVDIRIDNQRPREEQFNESHFLDSEASGDEEWTEGAEAEEDGYAW